MKRHRSWKIGILVLSALGIYLLVLRPSQTNKTKTQIEQPEKAVSEIQKPQNSIRSRMEMKPTYISSAVENAEKKGTTIEGVPQECLEKGDSVSLVSTDLDAFIQNIKAERITTRCGEMLEISSECMRDPSKVECVNQIIVGRAKLIDRLTQNVSLKDLDEGTLANKLVSELSQESRDENKIVAITDEIITKDFHSYEAHNVRSFYGLTSIVKKWDDQLEKKLLESNDVLKTSDRSDDQKKSIFYEYCIHLARFIQTSNPDGLVQANTIATAFINKFPSDPAGYYMMLQVSGYQGDVQSALKWIEKGLERSQGASESDTYRLIKRDLEKGIIKTETLGVRVDLAKQISTVDLINRK